MVVGVLGYARDDRGLPGAAGHTARERQNEALTDPGLIV